MARKSIKVIPKKRGRPATGKDPLVALRLPAATIKALDAWRDAKDMSRSEAIRGMIEKGLKT